MRAYGIHYRWFVERYWGLEDSGAGQSDLEKAWDDWAAAEGDLGDAVRQADLEEWEAWNSVAKAQLRVDQAEEALAELQDGPAAESVTRAELNAEQAALALATAQENLDAAEMRAPFDGVVAEVNGVPGEAVGTSPIVTLVDLDEPLLQFWVEEMDVAGVAVGNRVEITFEALPDGVFTGRVTQVDPALVQVGNTLAVQAWASIDAGASDVTLFGGMNADVEIISQEAVDVLLVPVEALRDLGDGRYAVFVVQPDGEMVFRPVEVGLIDFVNAEVISGLSEGEVVSLGVAEQADDQVVPEFEMPGDQMMPGGGEMMPGGGGEPMPGGPFGP